MRSSPLTRALHALVLVVLCAGLLYGPAAGCGSSKPFGVGISTAAPKLENDLRHYAAADPLHSADVDAFEAASKATPPDPAAVQRAWLPIKAWYSAAVEADTKLDPDERRLRLETIAKTDKLITDELARPLR